MAFCHNTTCYKQKCECNKKILSASQPLWRELVQLDENILQKAQKNHINGWARSGIRSRGQICSPLFDLYFRKNEQADISSPHSLKSISCKASERFLHPRTWIFHQQPCVSSCRLSPRAVNVTLRCDDVRVRSVTVGNIVYCRIRLLSYLQK